MTLYSVLYKIFAGWIRFFHQVKIEGAENEPIGEAFLACANHISNFDVLVLAASLKSQVHFFAKKELFKIPLLKQLITALGAFPVARGEGDVGAIKKTITLLNDGKVVGFYPQGTRHPGVDPRETEVKPGAGMLLYRTKVAALPVCIQTEKHRIVPFKRTYVRIGKPIYFDEITEKFGEEKPDYKAVANYVFEHITDMIKD